MKIAWLAGPNVDGTQDTYGTVEDLPDGSFAYGGDVGDMKWWVEDQQKCARNDLGREPSAPEVLDYALNRSGYGRGGRVKEVKAGGEGKDWQPVEGKP